MAHEVDLAFQWLKTTLINDPTLSGYAPGGVWRSLAPPATPTPFVVMSLQSGTDVITSNAVRIMDDLLLLIKVSGPALSTDDIASAAQQVDTLIGNPPNGGTIPGGYVLSSNRQSPLYMDEIVSDKLWTNIGGLYRIIIQQAPS